MRSAVHSGSSFFSGCRQPLGRCRGARSSAVSHSRPSSVRGSFPNIRKTPSWRSSSVESGLPSAHSSAASWISLELGSLLGGGNATRLTLGGFGERGRGGGGGGPQPAQNAPKAVPPPPPSPPPLPPPRPGAAVDGGCKQAGPPTPPPPKNTPVPPPPPTGPFGSGWGLPGFPSRRLDHPPPPFRPAGPGPRRPGAGGGSAVGRTGRPAPPKRETKPTSAPPPPSDRSPARVLTVS